MLRSKLARRVRIAGARLGLDRHWHLVGIAAAIGLVIGGAAGNVIDRFRFGAVADFLDLHWGDYHWPAFNLADAAISVGVVVLLMDALLIGPERHK